LQKPESVAKGMILKDLRQLVGVMPDRGKEGTLLPLEERKQFPLRVSKYNVSVCK
jgi:hypothetical protein